MWSHLRPRLPASVAAVALVVACRSGAHAAATNSTPCGDYFAATTLGPCPLGPTLPSAELSRVAARFEPLCEGWMALPGSQITGAQLEACAMAIQSGGCVAPAAMPTACLFFGTLASGAACNEDFQCESGLCFYAAPIGDAGPEMTINTCGQCQALAPVGQACTGPTCVPGASCDLAASPPTCVTPSSVSPGVSCDGVATVCDQTSYCDAATSTCAPDIAAGQSCSQGQPCAPPATCVGGTCTPPGGAGAACSLDSDCAAGLGCSRSSTCGAVTWVPAGDPCGDLARCLVGYCPLLGACPSVVPDGQSCGTDPNSTCDTLSFCLDGTCVLEDGNVCR